MKGVLLLLLLLALLGAAGCTRLISTTRADLHNGIYRTAPFGARKDRVYVEVSDDSIRILQLGRDAYGPRVVEGGTVLTLPIRHTTPAAPPLRRYYQPSFDLDVLTLPFKYRPPVDGFPSQLTTSFNAALYLGYRTDAYRVKYRRAPTGEYRRHIGHFGGSIGVFGGLGSTAMNPWVTQPSISSEYDGFILPTGLAAIVAVNGLTFGIATGIDHLMDEDRAVWIYRHRPWIGASFGVNLN